MRSARSSRVVLLLLGAAAAPVGAQVSLGVRGGVVRSEVDTRGPLAFGTSYTTGPQLGVVLAYDFGPRLSLETGIGFHRAGFAADDPVASGELTAWMLEVPVLVHLTVPGGAGVHPRATAGMAVTREVSCEVDFEADGTAFTGDCDAHIDARNKTDFALVGGIGAYVDGGGGMRGGGFFVDLLYHHGLRDQNDLPGADEVVKKRAWRVSVGLRVGG